MNANLRNSTYPCSGPKSSCIARATLLATTGLAVVLLQGCVSTSFPGVSPSALTNETITQQVDFLRAEQSNYQLLYDLTWPIAARNTEICGNRVEPSLGTGFVSREGFGPDMRTAAERAFQLGNQIHVYYVAEGSPGHRAGLRQGDRITRVGNYRWYEGSSKRFNTNLESRLRSLSSTKTSFELEYVRNGESHLVRLQGQPTCSFEMFIAHSDEVNAAANGHLIIMNSGLLRYMEPDEIQFIIAHELAHNIEGHVQQVMWKSSLGFLVDFAAIASMIWTNGTFTRATSKIFQRNLEREADYIAMYLLANANIDTSSAHEVWRRVGALNTRHIAGSMSHPTSAERFLYLQTVHEEIEEKRQNGEPLLPNRSY